MPEIATYDRSTDCVYVNSFGEVSLEEVQESITKVATLLKEHNSNRLIVDVRKQEVALPLLDTFTISKKLTTLLPPNLKIAYIVTNPPKQSQAFFTLLAKNLGQPIEVFYTINMAKAWVKNEYEPGSNPFVGTVKFPSIKK